MKIIERIKKYPVAFFGVLQGLWLAVLTAAAAFDWWTWTQDQEVAVNGIWLAVTAFAFWVLTGKVTPVSDPHSADGKPLVEADPFP